MAFQNWIQSDLIQTNFYRKIINGIKLIFKHPNSQPFKKTTVEISFNSLEVRINTSKVAHCYFTLINPDNNIR